MRNVWLYMKAAEEETRMKETLTDLCETLALKESLLSNFMSVIRAVWNIRQIKISSTVATLPAQPACDCGWTRTLSRNCGRFKETKSEAEVLMKGLQALPQPCADQLDFIATWHMVADKLSGQQMTEARHHADLGRNTGPCVRGGQSAPQRPNAPNWSNSRKQEFLPIMWVMSASLRSRACASVCVCLVCLTHCMSSKQWPQTEADFILFSVYLKIDTNELIIDVQ